MSLLNYESVIKNGVDKKLLVDAYAKVYLNIGLTHGAKMGEDLNNRTKFFTLDDFTSAFTDFIYQWLNNNKTASLRSISDNYQLTINKLISKGLEEGKTIREIAKEIHLLVNKPNFYRWQSLRIARTETTTASNLAVLRTAENYDFKVVKEWISSSDARTRRLPEDKYDHNMMNGVRVGIDEAFTVPNNNLGDSGKMSYPGDPHGQPGNVINCRCTIAIVPLRDANGNLIPKGTQQTPTIPNFNVPSIEQQILFKPAKSVKDVHSRIRELGINDVKLTGITLDEGNVILKTLTEENKLSKLNINILRTKNGKNFKFNGRYINAHKKIELNITGIRNRQKSDLLSFPEQLKKVENQIEKYTPYLNDERYSKRQIKRYLGQLRVRKNNIKNKIERGEKSLHWSISSQQETTLEHIRSTLTHEIGHNRHYVNLKLTEQLGENWQNNLITEYSGYNFKEYVAEWYTYWRLNGDSNVPNRLLTLFKRFII